MNAKMGLGVVMMLAGAMAFSASSIGSFAKGQRSSTPAVNRSELYNKVGLGLVGGGLAITLWGVFAPSKK